MALVILDGVIQEIGVGSYVNHQWVLSFVKVNGTRVKDVVCDDFMRSFLKVGKKVKLALVRRWSGTNILYSAQLDDGEVVSRGKALPMVQAMMIGFGISLLLSPIFMGIIRATDSILLSLLILVGAGMTISYLAMKDHFKARKVFHKPMP